MSNRLNTGLPVERLAIHISSLSWIYYVYISKHFMIYLNHFWLALYSSTARWWKLYRSRLSEIHYRLNEIVWTTINVRTWNSYRETSRFEKFLWDITSRPVLLHWELTLKVFVPVKGSATCTLICRVDCITYNLYNWPNPLKSSFF